MPADPKNPARIIDRDAWKAAVRREPWCVICGDQPTQSAHHILKRGGGSTRASGDDVPENLCGLCGSGTTGCHGRIEAEEVVARIMLGEYIVAERRDFIDYLLVKLGVEPAASWLERRLFVRNFTT